MKNLIKNCQNLISNFSYLPNKFKIEFEITKNQIELFEIIKNWKLNWKLLKNQFSFFFLIWKIKHWIENCPKSFFIFWKLLKIEQKWNGRFRKRMHGQHGFKWFLDIQNNWTLKFKFKVCFPFFTLIWKTKGQIYFNKYLMKLVTISPYAIAINK